MKSPRSRASSALPIEDTASELGSRLFEVLPGSAAPRLHGAKTVTAHLPSGRTVWLGLRPESPSVAEVNHLARSVELADARHAFAVRSQGVALEKLARRLAASTERLSEQAIERRHELAKRLAAGDAKLDARIAKATAESAVLARKERRALQAIAKRLRRRTLWDSLVIVSSIPLFFAYGEDEGRPFGGRNLTLFISLMIWLVGDDIADLIAGERDPAVVRDTDFWSYLAPFANVLTGWLLLRHTQRERFVTGPASLTPVASRVLGGSTIFSFAADVDVVSDHIARDHQLDFVSFSGVRALATVSSPSHSTASKVAIGAVSAKVTLGVLHLEVEVTVKGGASAPPFPEIQVAWAVDTREPS